MNQSDILISVVEKLHLQNYPVFKEKAEDMHEAFYAYISHLFETDFNALINLLYRLDVSEEKFNRTLKERQPDESYGKLIGDLILEREEERLRWRSSFGKG